ncbi:hypothetical protein BJ508DRAFT_308709 [Ascobolus immersus RN42]|uniref:Uncharacterized protein n=1 Tax=Ascobolus immersus RN42 TaxID=1160509 RepID=A0A3N4I2S7_ASCIM|nr:hypothetical protein BJ508DRAFT_308709 [Ascobolus immersus RN42]
MAHRRLDPFVPASQELPAGIFSRLWPEDERLRDPLGTIGHRQLTIQFTSTPDSIPYRESPTPEQNPIPPHRSLSTVRSAQAFVGIMPEQEEDNGENADVWRRLGVTQDRIDQHKREILQALLECSQKAKMQAMDALLRVGEDSYTRARLERGGDLEGCVADIRQVHEQIQVALMEIASHSVSISMGEDELQEEEGEGKGAASVVCYLALVQRNWPSFLVHRILDLPYLAEARSQPSMADYEGFNFPSQDQPGIVPLDLTPADVDRFDSTPEGVIALDDDTVLADGVVPLDYRDDEEVIEPPELLPPRSRKRARAEDSPEPRPRPPPVLPEAPVPLAIAYQAFDGLRAALRDNGFPETTPLEDVIRDQDVNMDELVDDEMLAVIGVEHLENAKEPLHNENLFRPANEDRGPFEAPRRQRPYDLGFNDTKLVTDGVPSPAPNRPALRQEEYRLPPQIRPVRESPTLTPTPSSPRPPHQRPTRSENPMDFAPLRNQAASSPTLPPLPVPQANVHGAKDVSNPKRGPNPALKTPGPPSDFRSSGSKSTPGKKKILFHSNYSLFQRPAPKIDPYGRPKKAAPVSSMNGTTGVQKGGAGWVELNDDEFHQSTPTAKIDYHRASGATRQTTYDDQQHLRALPHGIPSAVRPVRNRVASMESQEAARNLEISMSQKERKLERAAFSQKRKADRADLDDREAAADRRKAAIWGSGGLIICGI